MPNKGNAPARVPDCHPDRKHLAKGLCKSCYDCQRGAANRERMNAKARAWAAANPERIRATSRRYRYGLDEARFHAMAKAQGGLCRICMDAPARNIDHDHTTGRVRGLLCGNCNRALGLFRDDTDRLLRAVAYLNLDLLTDPLVAAACSCAIQLHPAVQVEANTGRILGHSTRGLA